MILNTLGTSRFLHFVCSPQPVCMLVDLFVVDVCSLIGTIVTVSSRHPRDHAGHVDVARANDCTGRRRGRVGGCLGLKHLRLENQISVCCLRNSGGVGFYLGYACFTLCSANVSIHNAHVVCACFDKTMKQDMYQFKTSPCSASITRRNVGKQPGF